MGLPPDHRTRWLVPAGHRCLEVQQAREWRFHDHGNSRRWLRSQLSESGSVRLPHDGRMARSVVGGNAGGGGRKRATP
jgi:hypothetical protein